MPHTSAKPAPVPTVTDEKLAESIRFNKALLADLLTKQKPVKPCR